jgi:HK97 family phage major capsid protein
MVASATAPSATITELSAKLTALRADVGKIDAEWKQAEKENTLSPAKQAELGKRYEALEAQIKPLVEAIKATNVHDRLSNSIREMDDFLNSGAPTVTTRDNPERAATELADYRANVKLNGYRGQQLRFFRPYGDSSDNRLANRQAALDAGLTMMALGLPNCPERDWALGKLRSRHGEPREFFNSFGQRAERLGFNTIAPFASEDVDAGGGYLVFPEFEAELINLKEQYGVLQQEANKTAMKSSTLQIPRRAGGTTVYYPEENTQLTASQMQFDKVQLVAKKYAQLALWSSELDEDSVINFMDMLTAEMAYQFARAEDFNGAQGDGTSTYAGVVGFLQALASGKNGIVPTASLVTITAAASLTTPALCLAGQTTAQILGFLNNLVAILPVYAEGRAKLYCHKTMFWQFFAPVIEAAGGNIAMYLTAGIPLRFLGYEVKVMQAMPTFSQVNGAGAANVQIGAVLGDMLYTCYMGTRRGVRTISSKERFMEFDQNAMQCTQRVAINNVTGDSVLPLQQAGPMVGLQFPAT